jgi:hypothetical protein
MGKGRFEPDMKTDNSGKQPGPLVDFIFSRQKFTVLGRIGIN